MSEPELQDRAAERERMVQEQIEARGIRDTRILDALRRVPRHHFLPSGSDTFLHAYTDSPQPIGEGQTISQPYIVALMSESLALQGSERVLEIGAGSGYQTAVLALLAREVIAIERHASLANQAQHSLNETGFGANVQLFVGDGSQGWPSAAPYDAILCAAVAPELPPALAAQLAPGGRLVLPIGAENGIQRLLLFQRPPDSGPLLLVRDLGQVGFVPLVGAQGFGFPDVLGDME